MVKLSENISKRNFSEEIHKEHKLAKSLIKQIFKPQFFAIFSFFLEIRL